MVWTAHFGSSLGYENRKDSKQAVRDFAVGESVRDHAGGMDAFAAAAFFQSAAICMGSARGCGAHAGATDAAGGSDPARCFRRRGHQVRVCRRVAFDLFGSGARAGDRVCDREPGGSLLSLTKAKREDSLWTGTRRWDVRSAFPQSVPFENPRLNLQERTSPCQAAGRRSASWSESRLRRRSGR